MRGWICGVLALAAVAGLALSAAGQIEVNRPRVVSKGVPAAQLPYTAEFKITKVQTLTNGSTITHETTEVVARDSQGRHMTASTMIPTSGDQTPRTNVSIEDPVAHTHAYWFSAVPRVTVTNRPEVGVARSSCDSAIRAPMQRIQTANNQSQKQNGEDLGKQTFLGLEAQGRRITTTYPVGEIGNSEELVRTEEHWFSTSPGLTGILVRHVSDDPEAGKSTREMVKFTQGEPDASLFQAPQDYEVVTQEVHDEVRCPQ